MVSSIFHKFSRVKPRQNRCKRVSMGLTVSSKTAKYLTVRRKNERVLTVSRKKMLTVKNSNHKIRSRDLSLTLMCLRLCALGISGRIGSSK